MYRTLPALLLLACNPGGPRGPAEVAPKPAPIELPADGALRYTLRFDDAHAHLVDVELELPGGEAPVELMMATWTPGSYLVREYARNVEGLEVDAPATVAKTAKNRWTVQPNGTAALRVRYRVYGREMSVRSNFVDADLGMLNGASTFLVPVGGLDQPSEIVLHPPESWPDVATALDPVEGREHTWRARDFDELVDSPIVAGDLELYPFEIQGVPHLLANFGESGVWDGPKSAADVEKIAREQVAFWGTIPYDRYVFLNVIAEAGGGLEHERSTLMLTSRWKSHDDDDYSRWLGLVSHEFFHTWNVKRLRPVELGPFDYENEVLTENLWVAEGFTSYYDDLLLVRAGLIDEDEWLARMAENVRRLQTTHGRLVHPLSETSRDTWIKFYRGDENSDNTTVSYYTKGAVVAFLLDAEIRRNTAGTRSLDTVMREAWDRYSGERGYTSEEFRAVASEVTRLDLEPWFARAVDSTDELDYTEALKWYGLRFAPDPDEAAADEDNASEAEEEPDKGWLGLQVGGGNRVSQVERGTPAWSAGINVDDEVVAVNGFRVGSGGPGDLIRRYDAGQTIEILVARRGLLKTLTVELGAEPRFGHTLEKDPEANTVAIEHRTRLLGLE